MGNAFCGISGTVSKQILIEDIKMNTGVFVGQGINIILANDGIELPAGQHSHNTYEFLLPFSYDFYAKVDKKIIHAKRNSLLPINPGQFHGPEFDMQNFRFLCIEIENDYLRELSQSIYNVPEILFHNENFNLKNEIMVPIQSFINESKYQQDGYKFVIEGIQFQIAVHLIRNIGNNLKAFGDKAYMSEEKRISKAIEYMNDNYCDELSIDEVSRLTGLSKFHFIRLFKIHTGKTPNAYLISLKIEKAKSLLCQNTKNITEICFSCGFNNLSHFTDMFKREVGVTPSEFRKLTLI